MHKGECYSNFIYTIKNKLLQKLKQIRMMLRTGKQKVQDMVSCELAELCKGAQKSAGTCLEERSPQKEFGAELCTEKQQSKSREGHTCITAHSQLQCINTLENRSHS